MDADYIKMHLVVDRYVQGKLLGDELIEFEERLVWDQGLQEEVELAETLRDWLRRSVEEDRYSVSPKRSLPGWLTDVFVVPSYAAAAAFVFGVMITSVAMLYQDTDATFTINETTSSQLLPLFTTRSNSDVQSIPVRSGTISVLLVDVPDSALAFNVSVRRDADATIVWAQTGLSAGYLDAVAVGIPGEALPPDSYTLTISSTDRDGSFSQEIAFNTVNDR